MEAECENSFPGNPSSALATLIDPSSSRPVIVDWPPWRRRHSIWTITWEWYKHRKLRPSNPPGALRVFRQKFRLMQVLGRAMRRRGFRMLLHCSRVRVRASNGYSSFLMIEVWMACTVSCSLKQEILSRSAQSAVRSHNSSHWSS